MPLVIQSSADSSSSSLAMSNSRFPLDDGTALKKFHNSTSSPKVREFDTTLAASDCWTKESIKQPVSGNIDDKHVKKEAPNMFKVIQSYMGDRKSKTSNDQVENFCENLVLLKTYDKKVNLRNEIS